MNFQLYHEPLCMSNLCSALTTPAIACVSGCVSPSMSAKSKLKEARARIDRQDYESALQLIDEALAGDDRTLTYNAFVLCAGCDVASDGAQPRSGLTSIGSRAGQLNILPQGDRAQSISTVGLAGPRESVREREAMVRSGRGARRAAANLSRRVRGRSDIV